ncbi:MAG: hypothetical protein AB8B56_00215 [Crocinitomicaceae bacterium]
MKLVLFFCLLFIASHAFGQDQLGSLMTFSKPSEKVESLLVIDRRRLETRVSSLYFELGGSGGFGSFNYEWNFKTQNEFRWMLRTGISGTYIDQNNGAAIIFPVMVHGIYGKKHGLDVGIGQALTITTRGSFFVRAPISVGYRLEPSRKRIFYRFAYTPIISYLIDFQWQHWAGITIGYKLRPRF